LKCTINRSVICNNRLSSRELALQIQALNIGFHGRVQGLASMFQESIRPLMGYVTIQVQAYRNDDLSHHAGNWRQLLQLSQDIHERGESNQLYYQSQEREKSNRSNGSNGSTK
jgi:hypothetical protein